VLRLYPPVPAAGFEATEDTFLPVGGGTDGKSPIFVPKGQAINYSVYAMHRRKDIYGPDAEMFRPERWEEKSLRPGQVNLSSLNPPFDIGTNSPQMGLPSLQWRSPSLPWSAIRPDGDRVYHREVTAGVPGRGIA